MPLPFALDISLLALVWLLLIACVHASLAVGVKFDAEEREKRGEPVLFVKPLMWGLAAFVAGVLAVAVYWLIHLSTLRRL
jgi:hypothetical protein